MPGPYGRTPMCDADVACLISAQAKPALSRSVGRCLEPAKPYKGSSVGEGPAVICRRSYSVPMPFFLGLKLGDSVTGGAAAVSATAPLPAAVVDDPGSAGAVGGWAQATAPPRATSRAKAIDFMGYSSYG